LPRDEPGRAPKPRGQSDDALAVDVVHAASGERDARANERSPATPPSVGRSREGACAEAAARRNNAAVLDTRDIGDERRGVSRCQVSSAYSFFLPTDVIDDHVTTLRKRSSRLARTDDSVWAFSHHTVPELEKRHTPYL
jgi:hypothetical protein